MATDDKGGNRTDLSGVTFIGHPEDGRESYHIRRASGKVLGPFDKGLMLQMIRGGKLTGDEEISLDRESWGPMATVPEFFAAMKGTGEALTQRPGSSAFGSQLGGAMPGAGDSQVGGWASEDPDALSEIPGLRKAAGPSNTMTGAGPRRPAPGQATSELPMPEGFTNFPVSGEHQLFSEPKPTGQATIETNAPPRLGQSAGPASTMQFGSEPPPRLGQGEERTEKPGAFKTHAMTAFDDQPATSQRVSGFDEQPATAQQPTSAGFEEESPTTQRRTLPASDVWGDDLPAAADEPELPASAGGGLSDLPRATDGRTNLPVSAAGLPTPAANLPTGAGALPTSAGGLPRSAAELPTHGTDLPKSAQTQAFGAQSLSGLGDEPTFTGSAGSEELPASARAAGPSLLEDMAQADDIWAAPDQGVGGYGGVSGQYGSAYSTDVPGGAPAPSGGFEDFFPGDADIAAPDDSGFLPEPPPMERKKTREARKRRGGSGWGLRIGLMLVLLGVLGGAAYVLSTLASSNQQEELPRDPVAPRAVVAVELPELATLGSGAYRSYVDFVDAARTAVGDRGSVQDRATFLVGAALLFAEHPEHDELLEEMRQSYATMNREAGADGANDATVLLGRAAYLAAAGRDEAPEATEALEGGPHAAWGAFFAGLYDIQRYRGVGIAELEEEADEAAGSGEGSGDTAAAEAPEEAEPEVAPEPETLDIDLSDDAAENFERAAELAPEFAPAMYWRGWVALETRDPGAAQSWFERALAVNSGHVGADVGVARSLLQQARLSDADERIQRVIDDAEQSSSSLQRSDTFVAAAEIAIARMQPEIAIESLLSALQAHPDNATALRLVGEQFFRVGQFARAVDFFSDSGMDRDDPEVSVGLAIARFGLEEYDAARNLLEDGVAEHPTDGRFPYWIGRTYEEEAEFELARQYYRQAMQTEPENVRPLVRLAELAQRENKFSDALRLLDEASSTNEGSAAMENEIGEMYVGLGETNRGVSAFRRALQIDGSQPDARINLTQYYLDSGQQQRALDELDLMLESGVESPRVHYLHARALHGMGSHDRAIEQLLVLLEGDPNNTDYLFRMGRVHFDAGNYAAARQQFVRTWEIDNQNVEAQYYIGRADIELGAYNEAITSLTAASQRSASGEYHYWLGVALERAEQYAQALGEYDQTINGDIAWSLENPDVFGRRGALFYSRAALRAAYRDLRTLLTLRPEHAEAAWILGRLHYDEGEYEKAIAALEYSLSLEPDRGHASFMAGQAFLRLTPANLEKAREHFEAAREAGYGDSDPEMYQKLAFVYRDLGENALAAEALEAFLARARLPYDEQREMQNQIRLLRGTR